MRAVNISPAVIRLNSQSLTSAGNVLLQRGAADHPTVAARLLELWRSFWYALAQVHLMELQDACGEREREHERAATSGEVKV